MFERGTCMRTMIVRKTGVLHHFNAPIAGEMQEQNSNHLNNIINT